MSLFKTLMVYHDDDVVPRSAAMNMAIDEALLDYAMEPAIRFYRWDSPALSFGYFGKFADVADYSCERDLVRRWTGGSIVLHGDDLTYCIVIPAGEPAFAESSMSIYEKIHCFLCDALIASGVRTKLSSGAAVCDGRSHEDPARIERRYSYCFANPVRADVLLNGNKVAGAAQRRTRRGLLQQGSIQNVGLSDDFPERFAKQLAERVQHTDLDAELVARANDITEQKYATRAWQERR
jgi:lipoyl(octanoyl) transferase